MKHAPALFAATAFLINAGLAQDAPAPAAEPSTQAPAAAPAAGTAQPSLGQIASQSVRGAGPAMTGSSIFGFGTTAAPADSPVPPIQWGRITVRPVLAYEYRYGEGIPSSPTLREKTSIHALSLQLPCELGTHWTASYTPSWRSYSSDAFRDTMAHAVSLSGRTAYEDWRFGLNGAFNKSSDPLIETGRQTDQTSWSAGADASVQLSGKLGADFGVTYGSRSARASSGPADAALGGSNTWSNMNWLGYSFTERLTAGVGAGFGFSSAERGADTRYIVVQGRASWRPANKIAFAIEAGGERRRFDLPGAEASTTPVYGASLQYRPFPNTAFSLDASRSVAPAYFSDQVVESTSWGIALQQRLLARFHLGLAYSMRDSAYTGAVDEEAPDRDDDSRSFSARLSTAIGSRGSASVFYQNTRNSSGLALFDLSSNQFGFALSWRF
jgi:hypothetical protein